jgi:23S rRNA U2552 (ribose-2'-O)-methylase RlmE/FtsJ
MVDYSELDLKANIGAFSTLDMMIHVPEVEKLKKGQVYLEVGVDKGKSLSVAKMVAKEGVEIWGVDLREDPKVPGTNFVQADSTQYKLGKKVDVIFIDGDHTYEGCGADIANWYPQMAKGGVMLFHDCDATSPGVVDSVADFVKEQKLKDVFYDPRQQCSMARIRLP